MKKKNKNKKLLGPSDGFRPPACDPTPGALILFVCHFQINGQDVQNRQDAVAALSSDECTSIVLLVARPETQVRAQAKPCLGSWQMAGV